MTLGEKHKKAFQSECNALSQTVLGSLLKLAANPKDMKELSKLVQSADTLMGNARFLQDKRHEDTCRLFKRGFQISGRKLAYNVCCKKDGSIKDLLIFYFFL